MALLQIAPCSDERFRTDVHRFGDRQEIRLVRFEEPDQRSEKHRITGSGTKLICPDSGQVKEPPRTPFVGNGSGERE